MIRLGMVGYGQRARDLIHIFREVEAEIRVVGVVDPDEAGARARMDDCDRDEAISYEDLDGLARQVRLDGLVIATRCHQHTPYAVQAARYDVPVYLEKPVAISMD